MITIESLVKEYWEVRKRAVLLNAQLQSATSERGALHQLIVARGGEKLLKTPPASDNGSEEIEERLEEDIEEAGSQYEVVKGVLPPRETVFTVEEIWQLAKAKLPSIARKSVTFNLWKLSKLGVVKTVTLGRGRREGTYKRA